MLCSVILGITFDFYLNFFLALKFYTQYFFVSNDE